MQSVQERPEMNRGQAAPSCNFRGFSACSPAARNKDQRTPSGLPYSPWSLLKLKCLTLSLLWSLSALLKHYLKDYFVSLPKQSPTHFKLSLLQKHMERLQLRRSPSFLPLSLTPKYDLFENVQLCLSTYSGSIAWCFLVSQRVLDYISKSLASLMCALKYFQWPKSKLKYWE